MTIPLYDRLMAFEKLGKVLKDLDINVNSGNFDWYNETSSFASAVLKSSAHNKWFTIPSINTAVSGIAFMLSSGSLHQWSGNYNITESERPETVAVIMAGNIPLVGFHDFLCVLVSGKVFLGKLSSDDPFLLPALAGMLIEIEPRFAAYIHFTMDKLKDFDAVIATGSNNSARYFDYYFARYPHIIRKNRNSIAILDGYESAEDIAALGDDIFMFFGLGCRNVSKLYLPENFDISLLFKGFDNYASLKNHSAYFNNYEYNRAIFLINKVKHLDNGFLILKMDHSFSSPVSVLHYETYKNAADLAREIDLNKDFLQCIVSKNGVWKDSMPFGQAQYPGLSDFADGVDTMLFLSKLSDFE